MRRRSWPWDCTSGALALRREASASLSAGLSLLLSIFNLLPAPPLDGGRILAPLLCALLGSEKEERIGRILGFAVGFILCALGIVSALKGKGAAPMLPGLWLLLREDL